MRAGSPAQRHERELAELAELVGQDARDVARLGRSPVNDGAARAALSALRQHVDLLAREVWKEPGEGQYSERESPR
jgi:hypothetical protein